MLFFSPAAPWVRTPFTHAKSDRIPPNQGSAPNPSGVIHLRTVGLGRVISPWVGRGFENLCAPRIKRLCMAAHKFCCLLMLALTGSPPQQPRCSEKLSRGTVSRGPGLQGRQRGRKFRAWPAWVTQGVCNGSAYRQPCDCHTRASIPRSTGVSAMQA